MITINASSLQSAVPQIAKAIRDAVAAVGQSALIPSDLDAQLTEAFAAAAPYINGATVVPMAFSAPVAKAAPAPAFSARKSPVSSVNAVWNDRCGRWQNSVTGAFIPFKS